MSELDVATWLAFLLDRMLEGSAAIVALLRMEGACWVHEIQSNGSVSSLGCPWLVGVDRLLTQRNAPTVPDKEAIGEMDWVVYLRAPGMPSFSEATSKAWGSAS
ncbi:hypothetical protein V6N11_018799 [Hibiscus sabdariffa]